MDIKEGELDPFHARQRDQARKDIQQVRVIKARDGCILTSEESVMRRWKKYFHAKKEHYRQQTADSTFGLKTLMEKYREGQKELHRVFSDVEKVSDSVPRKE